LTTFGCQQLQRQRQPDSIKPGEVQWRTVQEEDEQNKQLLSLTRQILALTQEVRGYAGLAKDNHEQNEQMLDMSRRALALTMEVHAGGTGGLRTSSSDRGAAHDQKEDDA
jgi:hypothetical protein